MTTHKVPQDQWKAQGEAARLAQADMLAARDEINKKLKERFGDKIRIEYMDDMAHYGLENLTQAEMDEFLEISGISRGRVTKAAMEPMPGEKTWHFPPPQPAPPTNEMLEARVKNLETMLSKWVDTMLSRKKLSLEDLCEMSRVLGVKHKSKPESEVPPPTPGGGETHIYRLLCLLREACRVGLNVQNTLQKLGATPEDFGALEELVYAAGKKGIRIP